MEPENIEERVSALEGQVDDLRRRVRASEQDAQAARVLAGAADRDVADMGDEVRGLRGEVTGLRGDVTDLRGEVTSLRGDVTDLRGEVSGLHGEFNDFRGEVTGLRGELTALHGEVRENHKEFTDFRKATMSSFNALRADMTDLSARVDDEFSKVANGFTEMRAKFDLAAAGQQQIVGLIQGLIDDRGGDPS